MIRFLKEDSDNDLYQQLVDFIDGKIPNTSIQDDLISKVNPNGGVIIDFGGINDFVELFDSVLEYIDRRNIDCAFSYHCTFDFHDEYSIKEEWDGGYLLRKTNDENTALLKKILLILSPQLIPKMFDEWDDDDAWRNTSELLSDTFSRDVRDIISDYTTALNNSAEENLIKEFENDFCEIFEKIRIHSYGQCFTKYYTTVKSLIKLYNNTETFGDNLEKTLKSYIDTNVDAVSYWEDLRDEMYNGFDDYEYQTNLTKHLENILEQLEDSDMFQDIEEYKKLSNIISKYNYGAWYRLPKDNTMEFRIIRIIPETNLIDVAVRHRSSQRILNYEVDYEQFNLILYHPELFRKFYD